MSTDASAELGYSKSEIMIAASARGLAGAKNCFVGVGLPNIVCNLAQRTVVRDLQLVYESGVFGARPERLPLSIGDPTLVERLGLQVEALTAELRRRVGGTFTIRELADEYARADVWARDVLSQQGTREWPRTLALVEGAAFHLYARGAVDYQP